MHCKCTHLHKCVHLNFKCMHLQCIYTVCNLWNTNQLFCAFTLCIYSAFTLSIYSNLFFLKQGYRQVRSFITKELPRNPEGNCSDGCRIFRGWRQEPLSGDVRRMRPLDLPLNWVLQKIMISPFSQERTVLTFYLLLEAVTSQPKKSGK